MCCQVHKPCRGSRVEPHCWWHQLWAPSRSSFRLVRGTQPKDTDSSCSNSWTSWPSPVHHLPVLLLPARPGCFSIALCCCGNSRASGVAAGPPHHPMEVAETPSQRANSPSARLRGGLRRTIGIRGKGGVGEVCTYPSWMIKTLSLRARDFVSWCDESKATASLSSTCSLWKLPSFNFNSGNLTFRSKSRE